MNKTKLLSIVVSLFVSISFISCDNEPIDSMIDLDDFTDVVIDDDDDGGISTGDYWPAALNNQWTFSQNGVNQQPMKIVSINSIDGNTYYTFNATFGTSTNGATASPVTRLRKSSGNYYLKIDSFEIDYGQGLTGNISGFETLLLKDYLSNGQTWTGTYNQTTTFSDPTFPAIVMNTSYTGEILNNNTSITVNGETFNNVINVRITQLTSVSGAPTAEVQTDYWFAKDVGPVKTINYDSTTNLPAYTSLLQNYILN
ncbi:MAG: hypothetical protein J0L86_13285 [Flavobacteriales bacterium]|nr:hypothetical protein [Flavobacteriales bacterium]